MSLVYLLERAVIQDVGISIFGLNNICLHETYKILSYFEVEFMLS